MAPADLRLKLVMLAGKYLGENEKLSIYILDMKKYI
jgi:hypothetical protein